VSCETVLFILLKRKYKSDSCFSGDDVHSRRDCPVNTGITNIKTVILGCSLKTSFVYFLQTD
jgi:hypothetical protein